MSFGRAASLAVVFVLGLLTDCSPLQSGRQSEPKDGVTFEKGAVVLTGRALTESSGSVLSALSGKVPNLRVWRHSDRCPEINLRNNVTGQGEVNPHVYVDGTRATDTCILETLRTEDVERVEVYPQGFTTRPGYGTHAHGLILVFMRSG